MSGAATASGSSTSTFFWIEWMSDFAHILGRDGAIGDLAQRDHGILVVVHRHGNRAAVGDGAGAMRGEQNQLEAVRHLVDAVFNCHACHDRAPLWSLAV